MMLSVSMNWNWLKWRDGMSDDITLQNIQYAHWRGRASHIGQIVGLIEDKGGAVVGASFQNKTLTIDMSPSYGMTVTEVYELPEDSFLVYSDYNGFHVVDKETFNAFVQVK